MKMEKELKKQQKRTKKTAQQLKKREKKETVPIHLNPKRNISLESKSLSQIEILDKKC